MPLYMAWRGALGDTGLWWSQTRDGITWTPHQRVLGAMSLERPVLAAWRGLLYLAWRDERDQALWWAVSDGSSWSRPRAVPGAHSSHSPALVAGHHGLHLYWKGPGADERLFHAAFDGRFWIPGQALFNGWPPRRRRMVRALPRRRPALVAAGPRTRPHPARHRLRRLGHGGRLRRLGHDAGRRVRHLLGRHHRRPHLA
ncbi:hypothetical protein [Streptomyces capuensis]|uniref:hypothetical protein n=1 Tax=Streptomyces capuensis TaxID=1464056 RepID=UPI001F1F54BF|nr:hypothetical protein [Streptomyces capuensis]